MSLPIGTYTVPNTYSQQQSFYNIEDHDKDGIYLLPLLKGGYNSSLGAYILMKYSMCQ